MSAEHTKLGIPPTKEQGRDAVHVSVAPALAGQTLQPGQWVGFIPGSPDKEMGSGPGIVPIGIVDPFRTAGEIIRPGTRFWLCLPPGTISGLTHVWTHPAFDTPPAEDATEALQRRISQLERSLEQAQQELGDDDCRGCYN